MKTIFEGITVVIVVLAIPIYLLVFAFTVIALVCIDVSRATKKWLDSCISKAKQF